MGREWTLAGRVSCSTCDFRHINFNFTKRRPRKTEPCLEEIPGKRQPASPGQFSSVRFGSVRRHGAFGKCLNGLIFVFERKDKTGRIVAQSPKKKNIYTTVMRVIFFLLPAPRKILGGGAGKLSLELSRERTTIVKGSWAGLLCLRRPALWPMKWCRKNLKFAVCLLLFEKPRSKQQPPRSFAIIWYSKNWA